MPSRRSWQHPYRYVYPLSSGRIHVPREFGPRSDAQLAVDTRKGGLNGVEADEQLGRHIAVRHPRRREFGHSLLGGREPAPCPCPWPGIGAGQFGAGAVGPQRGPCSSKTWRASRRTAVASDRCRGEREVPGSKFQLADDAGEATVHQPSLVPDDPAHPSQRCAAHEKTTDAPQFGDGVRPG